MSSISKFFFPWLLYAYPWMPYPRRVIIYLRERGIPNSLVTIVQVSDPQAGNQVVDSSFPPRPAGSLPILAIPSAEKDKDGKPREWTYIRQSMAIIGYLEETLGARSSNSLLIGKDALTKVRISEILTLAEECTVAW